MVYLVISDIHNHIDPLQETLSRHSDVDGVFFLGDGLNNFKAVMAEYPQMQMYYVAGNCDCGYRIIDETQEIEGFKIMYTHGHYYNVKTGLGAIIGAAVDKEVDILLFGHTHIPYKSECSNVLLFNPGALCKMIHERSYGIMILNAGEPPEFKHITMV